ncbi:MAG TPA: methyltransferase domain-containing protein [Stellaceae bacterium]|nr:methyltransferase domain-containing protein [Stellaceae bacterium]
MAEGDILIFDRRALRRHRERAARRGCAEFLLEEASERLAQRLEDVTHRFPRALALGARGGILARALAGRGGIESLVEMEEGPGLLPAGARGALIAEAEALPFAPGSFDLVVSALTLHWTNDLPGALLQLRHALRPDGMLLAALFGGETLTELRAAFLEAELELEGGASPRVAPMADARDLAGLLQRAGFALPVVDSDRLTVTYGNAFALMADLRAMGETNALRERRRGFTRRQTLLRMAELYRERHAGADGRIPASFEIVTLTAWAPHASQPKPLRPGSATTRLADALGTQEKSAGEKTGR